jgi:hypothetical protein
MFSSTRASTVISQVVTPTVSIGAFTFTDVDGTVEATALRRGKLYNVLVEGVTTPVGGKSALDLDISGHTSQTTFVTNNGDIYIGNDEDSELITITATAENGVTASTTRAVKGDQVVPNGPSLTLQPDTDSDNLEEVTPVAPVMGSTGADKNVIVIPSIAGVQYLDGATPLVNGSRLTIVANKTITAAARTGKELAAGAPTSFPFVYVP